MITDISPKDASSISNIAVRPASNDSFYKGTNPRFADPISSNIASKPKLVDTLDFLKDNNISETWDSQIMLHAKVYAIDQQVVSCDCIIDEESRLMERRSFPRTLFDNLANLAEGSLVIVDIKQKAGSMRIDIKNGKGIVDAQKFEIEHLIDSLKDF